MSSIIVVNESEIDMETAQRGRQTNVRRKRFPLDSGVPGLTLEFTYNFLTEGYTTPRHRHNFDQIRYTLAGVHNTGVGDLKSGECGYFPEGAYYGPQHQKGDCILLLLQFQGPSGEPFLGNEAVNSTYASLLEKGAQFRDGIYTAYKDEGGRVNKDSYTALWEESQGRPLEFSPPRYPHPIIMCPESFRWQRASADGSLQVKHLGTFTELRTSVSMLQLRSGATFQATMQKEAEIRYLIQGSVQYDGKLLGPNTYFYLPPNAQQNSLRCLEEALFFSITLPMINVFTAPTIAPVLLG